MVKPAPFHEARTERGCSCQRRFLTREQLERHVEIEDDRLRRQVLALFQELALIAGVV